MRIAQVAPLYERVPPLFYGGTERIVSYLTEELISQGHEITLFASGDSLTKGRLTAPCAQALRLNPACEDPLVYHFLQLDQVFQKAAAFDVVHFHIDYLHYPFSRRLDVPQLTTFMGDSINQISWRCTVNSVTCRWFLFPMLNGTRCVQ
jgi:glycosyltransferase involved in cell wall biosynthesis